MDPRRRIDDPWRGLAAPERRPRIWQVVLKEGLALDLESVGVGVPLDDHSGAYSARIPNPNAASAPMLDQTPALINARGAPRSAEGRRVMISHQRSLESEGVAARGVRLGPAPAPQLRR